MPANNERAYVVGLRLLATRELAEAQLRERLTRRQFESVEVDAAIQRLRAERALDDSRAAASYARVQANVRGRGRFRVLRHLQSMGIAPDIARRAVEDAFGDVDDIQRIDAAVSRRLRQDESLENPKVAARIHRYLLSQGFDAGDVGTVLRQRRRSSAGDEL